MAELQQLNWDALEWEDVNPNIKRKIITGDQLMVAKIALKDGCVVPQHEHMNEQVTQVLSGKMQFWFGANRETEMLLGPGDVVVIPAHMPHEAKMIGDVVEIDSWAPPRADWLDGTDDYLKG